MKVVSIVSVNQLYFLEIKLLPSVSLQSFHFSAHLTDKEFGRRCLWFQQCTNGTASRSLKQSSPLDLVLLFLSSFLDVYSLRGLCGWVRVCKEERRVGELYKALLSWDVNSGDICITDHQFILQEEWNCCHKLLFNQFWRPLHDVLLQKQCFGNPVLNVAYRIKTFYQHRLLLKQFWRPPHLTLQQKPSLVTQFQILNKTKVPSFTFRLRSASSMRE